MKKLLATMMICGLLFGSIGAFAQAQEQPKSEDSMKDMNKEKTAKKEKKKKAKKAKDNDEGMKKQDESKPPQK
jgi:sortase (surface protein transpeptidase)